MFTIRTELHISPTHGIGLFAAEAVAQGDPIYRHILKLDLMLTEEEFQALDPREQAPILHYGYIDKRTGLRRLDHDDIRFVNHSLEPNIARDPISGYLIAIRDIAADEELLQNYTDHEDLPFFEGEPE